MNEELQNTENQQETTAVGYRYAAFDPESPEHGILLELMDLGQFGYSAAVRHVVQQYGRRAISDLRKKLGVVR